MSLIPEFRIGLWNKYKQALNHFIIPIIGFPFV